MSHPPAASPADVIEVRPDERFDEAASPPSCAGSSPAPSARSRCASSAAATPTSPTCCASATATDAREYVLRRPPLGPVAPGSHDMSREHRVLSVLWKAFPLAPRAFLFCDDAR